MDCGFKAPLVSVVIPVYNVESYVADAIRSVLCQTLKNWELICVDDGSTDGSADVCMSFARRDHRIRVIHQKQSGPGGARNAGTMLASGEYLYYLDSDDMISPQTLETCVKVAKEHNADAVMFEAQVLAEDGGIHKANGYIRSCLYEGVWNGAELYLQQVKDGNYFVSVVMCVTRSGVFGECGVKFPQGIIHEDEYAMYAMLTHVQRVVCLKEQLYLRRYRTHSIMTTDDWRASTRGYFMAYALVLLEEDGTGTNKSAVDARKLYLKGQAKNCIEAFYRTGLPLRDFSLVVDAHGKEQLALQRLLCSKRLNARWFVVLRAAWRLKIQAYELKARVERRLGNSSIAKPQDVGKQDC